MLKNNTIINQTEAESNRKRRISGDRRKKLVLLFNNGMFIRACHHYFSLDMLPNVFAMAPISFFETESFEKKCLEKIYS